MHKLRPRQKDMLEFIQEYIEEHSFPPTIREIGAKVGISSTSVVNYNLERLEEQGLIKRDREVSRGLRLLGLEIAGMPELRPVQVPLYGKIAAGQPIPVPDDPGAVVEMVSVPSDLMPRSGEAFALRVQGKSMIDAFVDNGDIVVVRSQSAVETGEMAAVEVIDDDGNIGGTLKKFYKPEDQVNVELRPANTAYKSLYIHPSRVRVHGKVVAVLRQYE